MKTILAATALSLGLAALVGAASASADTYPIYQITAQGTLFDTYDPNGVFGIAPNPNGNEDDGQAFVATFTIDPSLGQVSEGPGYLDIQGGSAYGNPGVGPAVSASLEVNGVSLDVLGTFQDGEVIQNPSTGYEGIFELFSEDYSPGISDNFISLVLGNDIYQIPTQPGAAFYYSVDGTDLYNGGSVYSFNSLDVDGSLDVTSISSGQMSGAPEPSAWLLMGLGVGAAGLGLRRARRRDGGAWLAA